MQLDVTDLMDFYATPLGQVARRLLARKVRSHWQRMSGATYVGLGFCSPYLGAYRGEASHVAAMMPITQGALVWPQHGDKLSVLVDVRQLPLPDNSVDRFLVAHCLEVSDHIEPLLRELWRVLKPQGRVIIIVPNRRGVWAHLDTTPFGYGRPYSRTQLESLLRDSLLTPIDWSSSLHLPPFNRSILLRSAAAWERVGTSVWPGFGGVLVVEACKETMAPLSGNAARVRSIRDLVVAR